MSMLKDNPCEFWECPFCHAKVLCEEERKCSHCKTAFTKPDRGLRIARKHDRVGALMDETPDDFYPTCDYYVDPDKEV